MHLQLPTFFLCLDWLIWRLRKFRKAETEIIIWFAFYFIHVSFFSESVNSIQNARKRFLGALINHFSPLTIGGLQLSQENWNHFYLDGFTKHSVKWARPEKISLDLWNDTLTVCSSRNQILVSNRPKFVWKGALLSLSTINI